MPLPVDNTPFPPLEWSEAFEQFAQNDAWYVGDSRVLAEFYAGINSTGGTSRGDDPRTHYHNGPGNAFGLRRRVWRAITRPFWGKANEATTDGTLGTADRTRIHSPLAGNVATLSSDLLFAEPPMHRLMADGKPVKGAAQERFDEIANSDAMHMLLSQAGEWAAGISGVVLTAHWDADHTSRPWLQATACDAAIPEYEGARTVAVTLWTTHRDVNSSGIVSRTYHHLERHEVGKITHAVYASGNDTIGVRLPVAQWGALVPALAHLASIRGLAQPDDWTVELPTGINVLTAQMWRNLPTRHYRKNAVLARIGRADTEGIEPLLSQIDEVWSSWMRDIKIARARLIVPAGFLEGGRMGPTFDDDAEVLTGLEMSGSVADGVDKAISAQQFEIRFMEHRETILALVKEVLQHCGWSLSSYGEYGEAIARTATEVVDRTTASERTRAKKILYFNQAAVPINEALLALDRAHYNQPGLPDGAEIVIEFPEISQEDPEKLARRLAMLRTGMIASTRTLVAMAHPDWDETEREEEVDRILAENNLSDEKVDEEEDPTMLGRVDPITGEPIVVEQLPAPDPADPTNGARIPA